MVWVPTAPAVIPNEEAVLALLTRQGADPAVGYITPDDIAAAFQSFMSRDYWRQGPRNRVINGDFQVWQRGGGAFAGGMSADQWQGAQNGTTQSITRQAFAPGNVIPGNEPTYHFRTVIGSVAGAGNYAFVRQFIESVRTFAGQRVTVSWWAKADSPKSMSVELLQSFGTGGAPSADVSSIGSTKVALTAAWQRFTMTVDVPSIAGKTLGTTNDGYLLLVFWFDAGATFAGRSANLGQQSGTFDVWGVQLEAGNVPTTFEQIAYGDQLARCQRYLQRIAAASGSIGVGAGLAIGSGRAMIVVPTLATLRSPSIQVTWGPLANMSVWGPGAATSLVGTISAYSTQTDRVTMDVLPANSALLTNGGAAHLWIDNPGYLQFSAEL